MDDNGGSERIHIALTLCLPRDVLTVPLARHIVRSCMAQVGITDKCRADIEVALTEACTNVLDHSGPGDAYEVTVEIEDEMCTIRVVDAGHGFDWESLTALSAKDSDERGRGITLMRALVDTVHFTSRPESGTIVHLDKALELEGDSVLHRLRSEPAAR